MQWVRNSPQLVYNMILPQNFTEMLYSPENIFCKGSATQIWPISSSWGHAIPSFHFLVQGLQAGLQPSKGRSWQVFPSVGRVPLLCLLSPCNISCGCMWIRHPVHYRESWELLRLAQESEKHSRYFNTILLQCPNNSSPGGFLEFVLKHQSLPTLSRTSVTSKLSMPKSKLVIPFTKVISCLWAALVPSSLPFPILKYTFWDGRDHNCTLFLQ